MSKKGKRIVLFIVLVSVLLYIYLYMYSKKYILVKFQTISLSAEIADTNFLRQKGLSGRAALTKQKGMLFVFEEPGKYTFWMKDMLFPIDMFFLDSSKKIVTIHKNIDPKTYPKVFSSEENSLYVLETQADFADTYAIKVGDQVDFSLP